MSMRSVVAGLLAACVAGAAVAADLPNLGEPIDPNDIAPWDITIMPDGTGLPPWRRT